MQKPIHPSQIDECPKILHRRHGSVINASHLHIGGKRVNACKSRLGVGFIRTQPIPVFDPAVRSFDWQTNVAFNVGAGLRIFLTRYLTFFTEFRAYMWPDQFENVDVDPANPNDKSTWLQSGSTFVANTSIQLGFTVFLPVKFEYRLPK